MKSRARNTIVVVPLVVAAALAGGLVGKHLAEQELQEALNSQAEDGIVHEAETLTVEDVPNPDLPAGTRPGDTFDTHPGPLDPPLGVWARQDGTFLVIDRDVDLPQAVEDELTSVLRAATTESDPTVQATTLQAQYEALHDATGANLVVSWSHEGGWTTWSAKYDGPDLHINVQDSPDRQAADSYTQALTTAATEPVHLVIIEPAP